MVKRNDIRYAGMVLSLKLARELLPRASEIASRYRSGNSYEQIADELFPENPYRQVLYSALRKVLHGHSGEIGVEDFEGAIPKEELYELERMHKAHNGSRLYLEGRGIHRLTREERAQAGRVGGRISGSKSLEERKGIHALTKEERAENSRRLHQSRGLTLWTDEELRTADIYAQTPEYKRDFSSLANRINVEYHDGQEVRDAGTLRSALARYRRSKKQINA